MRWTCRLMCALSLVVGVLGCRHLHIRWSSDDDEEERKALERQRREVQDVIDQNAQLGSRWATHPDTMKLVDERNRIDARLAELDSPSRNR
jgi:hypothetical protein